MPFYFYPEQDLKPTVFKSVFLFELRFNKQRRTCCHRCLCRYDFMTLAHNIHACTLRQINWQKAAQRGSRVVTCEWHVHTATHWGRGSTCADVPDTQGSWSERPSPHTDSTQTTLHQPIHRQVHQLESPHSRSHRPLQHKELNRQKIPATVTCIPLQTQVCFSTECAFLSTCDLYA